MRRSAVALCLAASLLGAAAVAQQRQRCSGPQIGTWMLQSYTREDLATGQKTEPFGAHPTGSLTYGPDCRMSAILIREGRSAPASLLPTDAERIDLHRGMVSYAGTYSIDGNRVSHHVDASWNQSMTGTTVVRQFRIEGRILHITTLPSKSSLDGRDGISVLIWRRVE